VAVLGQLLSHEYYSFAGGNPSSAESYEVSLGSSQFGAFLGVASASNYLDRVITLAGAAQPLSQAKAPLPLIQTLDYLSYVLHADPHWKIKESLVTAPDLQSAAALGLHASNEYEFRSHMGALWTILNQLRVPPANEEDANLIFGSTTNAKGSLNHLELWLRRRLGTERYQTAASDAIATIRQIRQLRNDGAHASPETRAKAMTAKRSLRLPDIIADWTGAWELVKAQAAWAFDLIRQEVQGAPDDGQV